MNAEAPPLVFLDTNILVYAFDRSAGRKYTLAARLVESCWKDENGCLSLQVLQEFYVTVTRKIASPLDPLVAKQIVENLSHWRLHIPEAVDLLQAIDIQQQRQLSFWDALIVQAALRLDCRQLFSEDLNPGQSFKGIEVVNPFGDSSFK